jgi:hypothetical protein
MGALPKAESNPLSQASLDSVLRVDCERGRVKATETDRVEFKLVWNGGQADSADDCERLIGPDALYEAQPWLKKK